jgi:hypothetical protein
VATPSGSRYVAGMENADPLETRLEEIRDLLREQTDLYREMAGRSLARQEEAMRAVAAGQRLYRRVLLVAGLLVLLLIVWVLGKLG